MLRSLRSLAARYWSDSIGKEFAEALAERARAGLKVHVLLDWVGNSETDTEQLAVMMRAGVQLRRFSDGPN